ncbi:uncharacterized protein LOC124935095, partial [Impatiens glandulifera]|uniref:uncharacterized protein LOC124935095 n=1 Tax=Impatiens glandulifera TaxID=253017 RepID=UPI001FB06C8D
MGFLKGSGNSWQPVRTDNTTTGSYWLNWRVLLCSIWIITSLVFSYLLISKYEGPRRTRTRTRTRRENMDGEIEQEDCGMLYEDEVWMPCLKEIHPGWLLAFRLFAFFVLLILLILNVTADGADIFYYYTQWTFTLVTIYFGLGSALSIYGCYRHHVRVVEGVDAESGTFHAPENGKSVYDRQVGGFWAYLFQMIFQMNAGAVILTDTVFWFILFPFLEINKQYDLNVLVVSMHTINAIFLLGDTALNCLV